MPKFKYLSGIFLICILFVVCSYRAEKTKKQANNLENQESQWIAGGVVPHHLLVESIIDNFFRQFSSQNPKTVILVGPNHFEKGSFGVLSSLDGWDTPVGTISAQVEIINDLVDKKLVMIDEKTVSEEFSINGIVPMIKNHLPQAKLIPLILSTRMREGEIFGLADELTKLIDRETILIASVDFSHYLSGAQAEKRDKVTFDLIRNNDYEKILTLNNEYLDSPPSLVVLLKAMENLKKTKMNILDHTNSGIIIGDPNIQTTSYFSITFF